MQSPLFFFFLYLGSLFTLFSEFPVYREHPFFGQEGFCGMCSKYVNCDLQPLYNDENQSPLVSVYLKEGAKKNN